MAVATTTKTGARPSWSGRRPSVPAWAGTVPFLAYVAVFLLWPTGIVVVDSIKNPNGSGAFSNITELGNPLVRGYFIGSLKLCLLSSVSGAVFGAILNCGINRRIPKPAILSGLRVTLLLLCPLL